MLIDMVELERVAEAEARVEVDSATQEVAVVAIVDVVGALVDAAGTGTAAATMSEEPASEPAAAPAAALAGEVVESAVEVVVAKLSGMIIGLESCGPFREMANDACRCVCASVCSAVLSSFGIDLVAKNEAAV